jgi:hypothetical protein
MKKDSEKEHKAETVFVEAPVPEGIDLCARLPHWDPRDGVALKGFFLGSAELPSTITGQDRWHNFMVRLTAATMAHVLDENGKDKLDVVDAGKYVLLTVTTTLDRLVKTANNPLRIREVYLKPGLKQKTKNGFTVQTYEHMIMQRTLLRTDADRLPEVGQLPTHTDNEVPFDVE